MDSQVVKTSSRETPVPMEQSSGNPSIAPDNQLLIVDEQKMVDIEKPHHNDVLCGRGVTTNRHPGNESFRSLVGLNKECYVSSTKREKMSISRNIVQAVRSLDPPGRFLDKDTITGRWHDIGHKKAVEKTSQALRDGAAMLRKQLSDDLEDPTFLNVVFNDDVNKTNEGDKNTKERERISIKTNGKENSKNYSKGNSAEKIKVVKAKITQGKKGHRRVNSNPSALAIVTSKSKSIRRYKTQDEPRTPGPDYRWNYHQCPPSPRSPPVPPPLHSRSLPSSPMTWVGGQPPPPYPERHGSYSHHHSPYNHPPPSPYSPYSTHPDNGSYARNRSQDHYHGPPGYDSGLPPRHHSRSPHGSTPRRVRYHHHPSHQHYHHHSPPPMHHPQSPVHPRSPTPPPPPPSSRPLPPGRHIYSSGDIYSRLPPSEPREPWSPRRGYRYHQYETYSSHNSPEPHYSPHHDDHRPERTSSWTPRSNSAHRNDHYYDNDHPDKNESSGGLAVPCLGGEGRPRTGRFSPKLHLAPRSNRPMVRGSGSPPRPPSYSPRDFRPPTPVSPRYQRSNEDSSYYHYSHAEEEKKTSDVDKVARYQQSSEDIMGHKTQRSLSSSRPEPMKTESRSSPDQEEIEREYIGYGIKNQDKSESRASPGGLHAIHEKDIQQRMELEDDQSEEAQAVDDIEMSPICYDREDPVTLLDLPDDILALPISPCGPHDDPALS